jgi:uncharacterized membrane protein
MKLQPATLLFGRAEELKKIFCVSTQSIQIKLLERLKKDMERKLELRLEYCVYMFLILYLFFQ